RAFPKCSRPWKTPGRICAASRWSPMIIESHHVAKRFGRFEAIEDLSLRVPEGAVFALIGSNGTGKTTTIRMLMNILRPDRGDITVLGTPSRKLGPKDFEQIGYVSE